MYKELLSQSQPKSLFSVVSHLVPKHTLTRSDKEFHLLLSCLTTKPKFMCALYLAHNLPHSTQAALWGVISKTVRAAPCKHKVHHVCPCTHTYTHAKCTLMLLDASSQMHQIFGSGNHCERRCSPFLCCALITLVASLSSIPLLSSVQLYFFFYLSPSLCLSRSVCYDLVLTVFTLQCSFRNQGKL